MKITLINTYDFGGAAKACLRLHEGLLKQQVNSRVLLKSKSQNLIETYHFQSLAKLSQLTKRLQDKAFRIALELKLAKPKKNVVDTQQDFTTKRPQGLEHYSYPTTTFDITESSLYQEADIINLHWVADFLDWQSFFSKNTKPVVWTLHDQNPFLGGEHYAERFLGIDNNGFPIPREYTKREIEEEQKLRDIKRKALQKANNLYIVAPSCWLLESSQNSELFGRFPHYHIPYGFPTDIFRPYNKAFCREILGIPLNKTVLLFVADSVDNSRKGYMYLQKSLENISKIYQENIFLVAVGSKSNVNSQKNNILELGKIIDERIMSIAYNAADAFIIPSLEDNLPNTMIESILCGTPVLGFPTGGILDVIKNSENGYICDEISVLSLIKSIELFLDNPYIFDNQDIAQKAKQKYSLQLQAESYTKLYKSLLT